MCTLSPVPFHGDTIFCIDYHGQPFTPMRPIVENMGLDWGGQAVKLKTNKERWTVEMISTVAQDGIEREMLSMPVRKLPAWLNSINPKKVREELRAKIELYQNESDDALWNYWMNGRAERKVLTNSSNADAPITPDQQCTLKSIMRAKIPAEGLNKGQIMQLYQQGWSQFNNHFRIARYSQLPQSRMAEAVEYLVKMELRLKKAELPPSQAKMETPSDMRLNRKMALDNLETLIPQIRNAFRAIDHLIQFGCHPGKIAGNPKPNERSAYLILGKLYATAIDAVETAKKSLDAGYEFGKLCGRE